VALVWPLCGPCVALVWPLWWVHMSLWFCGVDNQSCVSLSAGNRKMAPSLHRRLIVCSEEAFGPAYSSAATHTHPRIHIATCEYASAHVSVCVPQCICTYGLSCALVSCRCYSRPPSKSCRVGPSLAASRVLWKLTDRIHGDSCSDNPGRPTPQTT
jgi:hypothetical protein